MSKSANIVAASLLNKHHVIVRIGRLNFRFYQPYIKDLARAFADERLDLSIDGRQRYSLKTMSKLLFHCRWQQRLFLWYAGRYSDYRQIRIAAQKSPTSPQEKTCWNQSKSTNTQENHHRNYREQLYCGHHGDYDGTPEHQLP